MPSNHGPRAAGPDGNLENDGYKGQALVEGRTGRAAAFYASLLIRSGASVKVVQSRLGHSSAKTTLDTYGHLWPDDEDRTRSAVDSLLRPADLPRSSSAP